MFRQIERLFWGSNNLTNGLIALAVIGSIALGCNCTKDFNLSNSGSSSNSSSDTPFSSSSDSDMPDDRLLKALVKETTADFAAAISSDDFSTLYSKSSTDFQSTYTEEQRKAAGDKDKRIDSLERQIDNYERWMTSAIAEIKRLGGTPPEWNKN